MDPTTGNVTIPKQVVGDYGDVTGVTMEGTGSVNSCQGTITLTDVIINYGGTEYPVELVLKKA